jgi:RND superfamily putative drug exporter
VTDPVRFFPPSAASRVATQVLAERFPGAQAASQIVLVCESAQPGTSILAARSQIAALAAELRQALRSSAVSEVLAPTDDPVLEGRLVSRDGQAALIVLPLASGFASEEASTLVAEVEGVTAGQTSQHPAFRIEVTGDATLGRDYLRAIEEGARRSALAMVALVTVTLLLVYRAPLAAGVSLATLGTAIAVASGAVVVAAQLGLPVAFQSRGFLVALVWGVGTDYCLLLFARTREEALRSFGPAECIAEARRQSAPVLVTSALAVVLACGLMGFARFGLFAFSGPALAIAVTVTLAAVLMLLPALMTLSGSLLFWPRTAGWRPRVQRLWPAIARLVLERPLPILIGSFAALAPLAWLGIAAVFSFELELDFPKGSVSERGFAALVRHFEPAQVSPLTIVLELGPDNPPLRSSDALDGLYQLTEFLARQPGVAKVWSVTRPTGEPGLLEGATLRSQLAALSQGLGQASDGAGRLANGLAQARQELAKGRGDLGPKRAELEAEQKHSLLGAFAPERFEAARRELDELDRQLGTLDRGLAEAVQGARALEGGVAKGRARLEALDHAPGSTRLLDRLGLTPEDIAGSPSLGRALGHYLSEDGHAARFELQLTTRPNAPASVVTAARLGDALATLVPALGFQDARLYEAGPTAITRDLAAYTREDMARLDYWIVAGVFVLLVALLRGLFAPLAVTGLILLSYFASLGALRLLADAGLWGGIDWKAPFFLFVLLVAIGADYGVFLLGRVREERRRQSFEAALARALEATGPVISSCGLVLAGTFATLALSRIAFLEQVGIGLTIGVLLDTCVVRPFLLPAGALLLERSGSS